MKHFNAVRKFGAKLVAGAVVVALPVVSMAAGESGMTSTETLAVIADAKTVLLAVAIGAAGALIAIKWVKHLRSAA